MEITRACLKASPSCTQHSVMAGSWFRQSQPSLHRCQVAVTGLSMSWHWRAKLRADALPTAGQVRGVGMGWQLQHQWGTGGDSNIANYHQALSLASALEEWRGHLCLAQSSAVLPSSGAKGLLCPANTGVTVPLIIFKSVTEFFV